MKRFIALIIICTAFSLFCDEAEAQAKVVRKTIKKAAAPQITPAAPPPMISLEVEPQAPLPPPSVYEIKKPEIPKGIFGWGLNTDLGAGYTAGRGSAFNAAGKIAFSDPFNLGSRLGLAEDAVEYKAGLGLVLGNDANNLAMFSLPLIAEVTVYLKEGSLFGLDPYVGGGFNLNLFGTDSTLGGIGGQFYGGILVDLGFEAGKAGISIGYSSVKVGSLRALAGLTFSVAQPIIL